MRKAELPRKRQGGDERTPKHGCCLSLTLGLFSLFVVVYGTGDTVVRSEGEKCQSFDHESFSSNCPQYWLSLPCSRVEDSSSSVTQVESSRIPIDGLRISHAPLPPPRHRILLVQPEPGSSILLHLSSSFMHSRNASDSMTWRSSCKVRRRTIRVLRLPRGCEAILQLDITHSPPENRRESETGPKWAKCPFLGAIYFARFCALPVCVCVPLPMFR